MNDILLSSREFYIYVLIGGAIIGALFGLIPLVLGRRRNKKRLGLYGFLASIPSGALSPLLGAIVAGTFSWLIVRDKPVQADPEAPVETNSSGDSAPE